MAATKTPYRRPHGKAVSAKKKGFPTWVAVAAGFAALLLVIGLLVGRNSTPGPVAATVSGGDDVAHVHGLGINPADGELYAATHYGLFRVPEDGKAERVGEAIQDTMGFTVVGADHFFGSGHPDLRDTRLQAPGKPPLLGLIESTDGGRTWNPISLLGEADFHSLVAAHGLIYGYDSTDGRLMVSADGKAWDTRAELRLGDFAVDPDDPDHLVGMTGRGLAESTDGGRSWSPITGPDLAFLTWNGTEGLRGVDRNGQTYQRVGEAWQPGGALPGRPQELLVTDSELYAAVEDGQRTAIYVSTDGGENWQLRYADGQR